MKIRIEHITRERITHDQQTTRLNNIRSPKKDLVESLQTEQRHVIEMTSEKESRTGSQLYRLNVTSNSSVEPTLQLLQGESFIHKILAFFKTRDKTLIRMAYGWSSFSRHFFEVNIFNPFAKSCRKNSVEAYKYHESLKCLKYEQRILHVEKSEFVPLVVSCMGNAGPSATRTIKQLVSKIAEKKYESYFDAITYIRTTISFVLLRSAMICLRGCRGSKRPTDIDSSCRAIVQEGRLDS